MQVAIVGGGAAGFFAAIQVCKNFPHARVVIFEKSRKVLAKVRISGGGRCNLTNACESIKSLAQAYPRGRQFLQKAFHEFDNRDAMRWFESQQVPVVIQDDLCVFPQSQDSASVVDCFTVLAQRLNITIETGAQVVAVVEKDGQLQLGFRQQNSRLFDKVIVTTGGSPKPAGLNWLQQCGHEIVHPVPSLFTFNMPQEAITALMGIVVEPVQVRIKGTKFNADGPLLITHWGMSGPAILQLSAFGARTLYEKSYQFEISVNWVNVKNNERVGDNLAGIIRTHSNKLLSNFRPYNLPDRLWQFLLQKKAFSVEQRWGELSKKNRNRLIQVLTDDGYSVSGKTTFKEEFVTCGGVSLKSVDAKTLQSKTVKNLYFAGEVLDIDGITGGFNFQAAWTTAFIAAKLG